MPPAAMQLRQRTPAERMRTQEGGASDAQAEQQPQPVIPQEWEESPYIYWNPGNDVILELEVDPALLTFISIEKWSAILDYSYIAADEADRNRHRELLKAYGVSSDVKAYMSQFYPEIKREIRESWKRLFEAGIPENLDAYYGNVWELRKEWIVKVIR